MNSYTSQLTPKLSVAEFEKILVDLDTSDPNQVAKEVNRCNNRCNGNRVRASLTRLKSDTGTQMETETIVMDFYIGTPPVGGSEVLE
jgi:hypothetical protein